VGSRGLRRIFDITLPLVAPGFISGATLVFILSFADFATPLVVGIQDLIASQAYLNIVQFIDRRLFKMGIRYRLADGGDGYRFLADCPAPDRLPRVRGCVISCGRAPAGASLGRILIPAYFTLILLAAFMPYLGVTMAAFGRAWSLTPFPTRFTLAHLDQVLHLTPVYLINTLFYSSVAIAIILAIGVPIAWYSPGARCRAGA